MANTKLLWTVKPDLKNAKIFLLEIIIKAISTQNV